MMEGPDPELRLSTLGYDNVSDENTRYREEIRRLTALLRENNISYKVDPLPGTIKYISKNVISNTTFQKPSTSTSTTDPTNSTEATKPHLPTEILLRILAFALKSLEPVIDPFYKFRKDNVTMYERFSRSHLNINCLAVCRDFHTEGVRILIESNDFVFTQAAALEHFAKISTQLRSTVKEVTLRVGTIFELCSLIWNFSIHSLGLEVRLYLLLSTDTISRSLDVITTTSRTDLI